MMLSLSISVWSALVALSSVSATTVSSRLPVIDLGYSKYQATYYNETSQAYVFKNIRYAAPPTGNRRFALPQWPLKNDTVQVNSTGSICYQAAPIWILSGRTSAGGAVNYGSEDCLFLDVVVPKKILDNAFNKTCKKAPVVAWIFGGGYVSGSKDSYTPANGLIEKGNDEAIFVAMNYRLGAFGFSSGPSFQASGGVANLAFYDQRFALYWIQKHIWKFGGNRNEVTIMGESAGGGSVMHQITAYAGAYGNNSSPFKRAVPQSPGWVPTVGHYEQESTYVSFLKAAGCLPSSVTAVMGYGPVDEGLACLRKASTGTLLQANLAVVAFASYGQFGYGPVVDGVFAPDLPGSLLAQGKYDHDLELLIGHNADEGYIFTPPTISNTSTFDTYLDTVFPAANQAAIDYVREVLYPPPSNKTPYANNFKRADLMISEVVFTCNTVYFAHAFQNKTFNYLFSVPPAVHGQDIAYTFYDSGVSATAQGVVNATVANLLQTYIMDFVINGNVNKKGIPYFPMYGTNSEVLSLNATSISEIMDPAANVRCTWWQKSLYF